MSSLAPQMDPHQFALYAALSFQTIVRKWNTWKSEEIVVVTSEKLSNINFSSLLFQMSRVTFF